MLWRCECRCGKVCLVRYTNLKSGKSQSCGCRHRERQRAAITRHGLSRHRVYRVYKAMVARCANAAHRQYHNYGGAGITVCRRWQGRRGFDNFVADMGVPAAGLTLERRRVTGGYRPGNCVWLAAALQGRNKRNTVRVRVGGKLVPLVEVAERFGINYRTLYGRYRVGLYRGGVPAPALPRGHHKRSAA